MGLLSMFGLMRVEDHNRIVAKQDALIDRAAEHMKGEDFDRGTNHADRVALVMARLRASRTRAEKAEASIKIADNQTSAAIRDRDILRRQLDEAKAEAVSLRPDAEWARARKAKAAEYEASKRVRKASKKDAANDASPKVAKKGAR